MEIVLERVYGQPKLKKPTFLKNTNLLGAPKFGKASCKLWQVGDDFYLLHRDWFSDFISKQDAKERGLIDSFDKRFIYNDCFGAVVFRNEALLKFSRNDWQTPGISASTNIVMNLAKVLGFTETALCLADWEHLFEQCIKLAGFDETDTIHRYGCLRPLD